jgi:hypothetical protein
MGGVSFSKLLYYCSTTANVVVVLLLDLVLDLVLLLVFLVFYC